MQCSTLALFLTGIALGLAQAPPATQTEKAHVEGQITNAGGEPLKKAMVRLQGTFTSQPPVAGMPVLPTSYTSETDAAGHFVFEEVDPGRYTLSAERTGYVRTAYGARSTSSPAIPVNLAAGQKLTGLSIKLTPQGTITGRVLDEDGDPVGRAQVMVSRMQYQNGRKALMPAGSASSLPDGTYQVFGLAAGRYYLNANDVQSGIVVGQNELPGRKGPQETLVATYYPNALDLSSATPIDITPGSDMRGIDIRLQKARVFRVRGKVIGAGPSNGTFALQLVSQDSMDMIQLLNRMMNIVRPDGSFDFPRVLPGTYTIRAQNVRVNSDQGPSTPLFCNQVITVSDANLENVEVVLAPGGEISGTIRMEGRDQDQQQRNDAAKASATGAASSPAVRTMVLLSPVQLGMGGSSTQAKDDGTFQIKNIAPDKYNVVVNGLPAGAYLKSVRYGGQDVTRTTLDLTSGASGQLDVLLSPDAADIAGVVHNSKGETIPSTMIGLWESGATDTGGRTPFYRTAMSDQNGNFQLKNLPPGEYKVAAWEVSDSFLQDPSFRAKFESQAATVKVGASAHGNTDLTLISQEAIEVEAAKLR